MSENVRIFLQRIRDVIWQAWDELSLTFRRMPLDDCIVSNNLMIIFLTLAIFILALTTTGSLYSLFAMLALVKFQNMPIIVEQAGGYHADEAGDPPPGPKDGNRVRTVQKENNLFRPDFSAKSKTDPATE